LGSGVTSYLNFYEELASKNNRVMVICLEPFKLAIKVLDNKIERKDKIMQVCGFGENIPFMENLFDLILMQSSYAHFFNLEKVLENVYTSLKDGGRLVIFEEHAPILEKSEFWTKHHRDHTLEEAILEIQKYKFKVLDNFEHDGSWGILALKS
jgi:SAM-dependent methyltransferase